MGTVSEADRRRAVPPGFTWSDECALVDAASAAYQVARREVFDLQHDDVLGLSPRQRQVLVELEAAEQALREFRTNRLEERAAS